MLGSHLWDPWGRGEGDHLTQVRGKVRPPCASTASSVLHGLGLVAVGMWLQEELGAGITWTSDQRQACCFLHSSSERKGQPAKGQVVGCSHRPPRHWAGPGCCCYTWHQVCPGVWTTCALGQNRSLGQGCGEALQVRTETGAWLLSCLKGQTGSLRLRLCTRSEKQGHHLGWGPGEGSYPCLWGNLSRVTGEFLWPELPVDISVTLNKLLVSVRPWPSHSARLLFSLQMLSLQLSFDCPSSLPLNSSDQRLLSTCRMLSNMGNPAMAVAQAETEMQEAGAH